MSLAVNISTLVVLTDCAYLCAIMSCALQTTTLCNCIALQACLVLLHGTRCIHANAESLHWYSGPSTMLHGGLQKAALIHAYSLAVLHGWNSRCCRMNIVPLLRILGNRAANFMAAA